MAPIKELLDSYSFEIASQQYEDDSINTYDQKIKYLLDLKKNHCELLEVRMLLNV